MLWILEGINYLHVKFQINILKNKKVKKFENFDNFDLNLKKRNGKKEKLVKQMVFLQTLKSKLKSEFTNT